ncbi:MAG: hypothetical protein MJY58_07500 [Bacteroidaceae bacterium]|nr:hypothetical protein [Bacteroidaceae bacterium]
MKKLNSILIGLLVSFLCYAFNFSFLPGFLSTKNIATIVGALLFIIQSFKLGTFKVDFDVVMAGLIAIFFSGACFMSATLNLTRDLTYATYIVSFLLWAFGAHGICSLIRMNHGRIDLELVCFYFIWVAVFQCVLSQLIHYIPAVQNFIDSIVDGGNQSLKDIDRLYGLGASLDVAGTRFAVAEVLIAYLLNDGSPEYRTGPMIFWSYVAFIIILIFGCMVSRTTTVGALLAIVYAVIADFRRISTRIQNSRLKQIGLMVLILLICIPLFIFIYRTDPDMRYQMRFAFEGFFNYAETGVWRTDSTDKLNGTMWIWPTDSRGWFIGYGLFGNWAYGTDIGYCRFILYCGILGFSIFAYFFIFLTHRLARRNEDTGVLAFTLLLLVFTIWIKVSTDIFFIYILLISVNHVRNLYVDLESVR